MDFLVQRFPIQREWDPSKTVGSIKYGKSELPVPHEWVDKEDVPRKRHHSHLCAVWILEVDSTVFDIIT
jgi:hypothetical protein